MLPFLLQAGLDPQSWPNSWLSIIAQPRITVEMSRFTLEKEKKNPKYSYNTPAPLPDDIWRWDAGESWYIYGWANHAKQNKPDISNKTPKFSKESCLNKILYNQKISFL